MFTTLISTQELADHLDDPRWVVVDIRFNLTQPDWGFGDYQRAHIPGAVFADLDRDLSAPRTPSTGRHPLPTPEECKSIFERLGISEDSQVVVYDANAGGFAGRLWWMLRLYGHSAVALLDGSFAKWTAEGRPVHAGVETRPAGHFTLRPQPGMIADAAEVEKIRLDPSYRLLDGRSLERFLGSEEPIDPVAGHIPGAVSWYFADNLVNGDVFLSPEKLRQEYAHLLAGVPPERTVVYCGSGVTSCHLLIAMELAGLKGARLYPGSWSEWIRDPSRPVATGD